MPALAAEARAPLAMDVSPCDLRDMRPDPARGRLEENQHDPCFWATPEICDARRGFRDRRGSLQPFAGGHQRAVDRGNESPAIGGRRG